MTHRQTPDPAPGPAPTAGLSALLVLADGRFPAGGHAHSGGLEAAVAAGRVRDAADLESFLRGRVATSGATAAAFAAAACGRPADPSGAALRELDAELDARTPSPALRAASRRLGRQLLRAVGAVRPHPELDVLAAALPEGPHQPVGLGVAARVLGLGPHAAATAALHEAASGPATAAVRLLGLDPFAAHGVLVRLGPQLDALARDAAASASAAAARLAALGAPMLDISAQTHAAWEVRLFAS
ncbi:urease accessory protein UreF [Streptomyces sp. NPDC127091]|uniref:Urease accessory protein UreF n=1 Tax=Streptomyces cathayae TaxID=3031124 RepID=A0ABY8K2L8_9ACTN|nr:urease accessory UreF family protein [Streptomyces sp. HUAS 5]WGD40748.1 urease accessory UreF family protein [Streptomyces sp. HUAS 5]